MRVRLALIPLFAAAVLLAGCGSDDPATGTAAPTTPVSNGVAELPPDQILAKAQEALKNAKSFHVKGKATGTGTGTGTGDAEAATEMDLAYSGTNVSGSMAVLNTKLEIIAIDNAVYIKGADQLLASTVPDKSKLALIKDKWVKFDSSQEQYESFAGLTDRAKFADSLKPVGTLTKGEKKTINGTPTIGLVDGDESIMYVATESDPFPLRIERPGSTDVIEFSEFNSAAEAKAPDAANVIDVKTLKG